MKKCCNNILIPKIKYKASIIDSIGLFILLSFFLSIALLIAWGGAAWLVSDIESGKIGERGFFGQRTASGGLIILAFLYYFLPKFINACTYLVNYQLNICSVCKICGKEHRLANYPKSDDPF